MNPSKFPSAIQSTTPSAIPSENPSALPSAIQSTNPSAPPSALRRPPAADSSTARYSRWSFPRSRSRTPPRRPPPSPPPTLHRALRAYAARRLPPQPAPRGAVERPAAPLQLQRRDVLDVVVLLHREHEERDVQRHAPRRLAREQVPLHPREPRRNVHHLRRPVVRLVHRRTRRREAQPTQHRRLQLLLEPVLERHAAPRGSQPERAAPLQRTENRGTLRLHHLRLNRGNRRRRWGNRDPRARLGGSRRPAGIGIDLRGGGER